MTEEQQDTGQTSQDQEEHHFRQLGGEDTDPGATDTSIAGTAGVDGDDSETLASDGGPNVSLRPKY